MTALGGSKAGCSEKQRTKLYCDCWKSSWALVHAGRWILRKPDQTKRVTFYFIKKRGIHFLHLLICHLGVFWGKLAFLAEVMLCCTFCSCRLTENIFLWKLIHWKSCRRTSVISYSHCQMTCRTSCSKLAQRDFCVCVCVCVQETGGCSMTEDSGLRSSGQRSKQYSNTTNGLLYRYGPL